jgi:hypothetical protein
VDQRAHSPNPNPSDAPKVFASASRVGGVPRPCVLCKGGIAHVGRLSCRLLHVSLGSRANVDLSHSLQVGGRVAVAHGRWYFVPNAEAR